MTRLRLNNIAKASRVMLLEKAAASPGDSPTNAALISQHPDLQGVSIQANPQILGGYAPEADRIGLGVDDPVVAAHELAHAARMRKSTMYQKLLLLTDRLSKINRQLAEPLASLAQQVSSSRQRQNDYLNLMSGVSAMLSAPRIAEELGASTDALHWLNEDPVAAQRMQAALGAYVRQALDPIAVYQLARS